jgi:L-threonylcarbamoyladenylate synthase
LGTGTGVITTADSATFARCIHADGVAVFPADTVYGLACDPDAEGAVQRLYALKGRRPDKPAAVMFFSLDLALAALHELDRRTRAALERLLPGGVTVLLPNPARRFPLACGPDPDTLGLRVPALPDSLAPLAAMRWPVLQSSANRAGEPAPRRLADVPGEIRHGADCVLDGGELPGTASTVVDLRAYAREGRWTVVRKGAVGEATLVRALDVEAP